jgi:hypothetical protein
MTRKALVQPYEHPCHFSSSASAARHPPHSRQHFTRKTRLTITMPPRKKAKASAASTPLGDGQPGTPLASNTLSQDELLNDPWEDEQEIQLLKSMMKWKPTGK